MVCTLLRIPIPFISTPKDSGGKTPLWVLLPQFLMIAALAAGIGWKLIHWRPAPAPFTLFIASLFIAQQWILHNPIVQTLKKKD
jgi:hypothetical protein